MIPNAVIVLVGLSLAYSAIFSTAARPMNNIQLAIEGVAVAACAILAWRRDIMGWQSRANVVLGAGIAALAGLRMYVGVSPLVLFWIVLLAGITVAIGALWSIVCPTGAEAVA